MNYYYIAITWDIPIKERRKLKHGKISGHLVQADNEEKALEISKQIKHQWPVIHKMIRLLEPEIKLHHKELIERRKKGIGGIIWK